MTVFLTYPRCAAYYEGVEAVYSRFGHEIQRLRKQRNISQSELARLIDPSGSRLSRSSIANIESGRQRVALHLILDLARALEVDARSLLPDQPPAAPSIVERAVNLSAPEQEWLTRIVAKPSRRRRVTRIGDGA